MARRVLRKGDDPYQKNLMELQIHYELVERSTVESTQPSGGPSHLVR